MVMKLLPKKELNQAIAENKRQEIDEGKKLVRQIEGLRRTKSDEEASLEKFRSETLNNIKAELLPWEEKLATLKKEVGEAERTRDELRKPLDDEWAEVEKVKEDTLKKNSQAVEKLHVATEDRKEAKELLKKAEGTNARALTCEELAQDKLNNAIIVEREAKELKDEAETTKKQADAREHEVLANIAEEHRKLKLREDALAANEAKNKEEAEENRLEKLRLADERQTLERALKRIKK